MDVGIVLSKLLPLLVYPFTVSLGLSLLALVLLWAGKRRAGIGALAASIALVLVCSSPQLATWLYARLERQYLAVPVEQSPEADAIVVLGGGIGPPLPPRVDLDFNASADRVWHAARLYRAGKAPSLIVSGGNVFPQRAAEPEAVYTAALLADWGVAREHIIIEAESRNTFENARRTRAILEARGMDRILLVTSAFHMPRALATFRAAGIDAVPSPTDFRVVAYDEPGIFGWLPSLGALGATTTVIQELLGRAVYRLRDWLG